MNLPQVVSGEEWLAARKELLDKEKEATRARDGLNAERRGLPMVRVEKEYVFEEPDGPAKLLDLFEGRRQLIVQHFMFDPEWDDCCPSCTYRRAAPRPDRPRRPATAEQGTTGADASAPRG